MKTYYMAKFNKIEPVKIIKETACFVWLEGDRRESKETIWYAIKPTWDTAKQWLIDLALKDLNRERKAAKDRIAFAEKELREAMEITK